MALVSPGTQVTIIDQSQYLPAASNSVPLLIVATASNKINAAGETIATGTLPANAGKLYQITSQRDLTTLFGNPFFYKTTDGTPIHGYELNEYGLLAAYSLMGITNRCYILRADIDLAALIGTLNRPKGNPPDGTFWLDSTSSTWGIYEWNAATSKFTNKKPLVIANDDMVDNNNIPLSSLGNIGQYAIDARDHSTNNPLNDGMYWYKTSDNIWVRIGSKEWSQLIPAVVSAVPKEVLDNGKFYINYNNQFTTLIEINGDTTADAANAINAKGLGHLSAKVIDSQLCIYSSSPDSFTKLYFTAHPDTPNVLDSNHLNIKVNYPYWQPAVAYGYSSEMPLWSASQNTPRPTGSIWIKISVQGNGVNLVLSRFSKTTGTFVSKKVNFFHNIAEALYKLDSNGGKNIPAGTIIGETLFELDSPGSPMTFHERIASGPTIATGTVLDPVFNIDTTNNKFDVIVSVPNSINGSATYTVVLPTGLVTAAQFLIAWQAAKIPYTTITLTATKQIQITHTEGGGLLLAPHITAAHPFTSTYVLDQAGFTPNINPKVVNGYVLSATQPAATQNTTTGSGSGATFSITAFGARYIINGIISPGMTYQPGDQITIKGSQLFGADVTHDIVLEVTSVDEEGDMGITGIAYVSGAPNLGYYYDITNWKRITYIANEGAPYTNPPKDTKWYYSSVDEVDIMVQRNGEWRGYRNVAFDINGHPVSTAFNQANRTDVNGPIISTEPPTVQSDGISDLYYGDLWLDSNDLENYPALYRWKNIDGIDRWVKIDNTDQTSSDGILFADARWAPTQYIDPVNDPKPTIKSLLTSNYLDLDAPNPALYPQGMILFNTRRSGYNVKQFKLNYFNAQAYPDATELPAVTNTWISVSGLKPDGSAYMGRKAQRNLIVQALKSAISTNMTIREEDNFMNLIATPGYPELQPDMVELSNERNNTAFVIGDTPLRLDDQATNLINWAQNKNNATATGEDGLVGRSEYMGIFYPSGITTDLTGAPAVVPASHMILRTILHNDTIAYPWLAPAGTRRGTIDNATNIGYLDATTGEFKVVKNRNSIRDVLYTNQINPLAFFTGVGLLNYGNKTSKDTMSALDRINVARLVCYIRERLQVVTRPFVFEPNDSLTRSQIQGVVQTLFIDLVARRGLYDFLVVCDDSNNTADRIDRNELYIDIAIEPVKAAEFIYIPVRILNTGGIAKLK